MNEMMFERLATCVYNLVENAIMRDMDISYVDACEMMGLDRDETEAVLAILDEDMRLV